MPLTVKEERWHMLTIHIITKVGVYLVLLNCSDYNNTAIISTTTTTTATNRHSNNDQNNDKD